MTLAVAAGTDAGGLGLALVLSAIPTVTQLLVVLGRRKLRVPGMLRASTRAGEIGLLALYSAFTLFFLVGLILAL